MKKTVLFALLLFATHLCYGWGQNGHRIVAQICYDNLSDEAREKIDEALGDEYLTQVATWPDFIRSEKKWDFAKNWHFATFNTGTAAENVGKLKESDTIGDVIDAIELMRGILDNNATYIKILEDSMEHYGVEGLNNSTEATAIAFLVHFIGDIHQPMHVGKNHDHGGNSVAVLFFDERSNLHSVWDQGIIQQEQLSFTEFATFVDKHQMSKKSEWEKSTVADWANESINYREQIYNSLYDNTDYETGLPDFSYQYQHDFLPIVEERLAAAGFRAAELFNELFDK